MKNLSDFPKRAALYCRGGSVRALAGIFCSNWDHSSGSPISVVVLIGVKLQLKWYRTCYKSNQSA